MTLARWLVAGSLAVATGASSVAQQPAPRPRAAPAAPPRAAAIQRPAPRPAEPDLSALLPATQALFAGYVREGRMPGIVGAFGAGDLPTAFVAAGRIADDAGAAAAGPDSLWRVYSMTKPITGIAAMILIEEGRLKLDQPLTDFFPAFRTVRVATSPDTSLASVPATRPITIRMLMTHTSGLGYSINAKGPLLREYERLGLVPATLNPAVEVQLRRVRPASLAAFAERAAQAPLVAQPGTRWHYSIGLDVLGAVIEKASGMPFDTFLQTRIFTPLRMDSTGFTVRPGDVARFATNYAFVGADRSPIDPAATSVFLRAPSFPYGGAGLVSSARDYDRFLHMLQNRGTLDGVRILKPETATLAMSNLLPAGVTFGGVAGATGGSTGRGGAAAGAMGFGAGGSVVLADGAGGVRKGMFGWGGAAGTFAFVDPVRGARGTVMVNYFPADRWPIRQEVPAALARDLAALRP